MAFEQLTHRHPEALSLADAKAEFILHQRISRHTPKTLEYYGYVLGRFGKWLDLQSISRVEDIDQSHLRRFILDLQAQVKPNSVRTILRGIRAFFNFLLAEDLIPENPMLRIKMPRADSTLLPAFTCEEIGLLERATEGKDPTSIRNRALIHLLLDSGLRLTECASLRVGDVDPATGVLKVLGKGRKERISKLGSVALRSLNRYSRLRQGERGDPLWLGKKGPMTRAGIAETLERLGKKVGVHSNPHKFRRSCALYMLRSGADVFSVQHLMGHADLTVLRRYLAQTEADVTRAHERHSPVDSLRQPPG